MKNKPDRAIVVERFISNRKNMAKAADLKAARRRVAMIERFVKPINADTFIQLRRMYGDDFERKLDQAYCLLLDCREIVLDAEKKEPEPTT